MARVIYIPKTNMKLRQYQYLTLIHKTKHDQAAYELAFKFVDDNITYIIIDDDLLYLLEEYIDYMKYEPFSPISSLRGKIIELNDFKHICFDHVNIDTEKSCRNQTKRLKKLFSRKEFTRTRELLEEKQHEHDENYLNELYFANRQILTKYPPNATYQERFVEHFSNTIDEMKQYYPDFEFNLYDSP